MYLKGIKWSSIGRLLVGTLLMAIAVGWFFEPAHLVTGGFTGIAIIVKTITQEIVPNGIPLGLTTLVCNLPLFWWTKKKKGMTFLKRTLLGTLLLSFWLSVLPEYPIVQEDALLSALLGGVSSGLGLGFVFRSHATTGGTDLLSLLLQQYLPHKSVVEILLFLDGCIVLGGLWVFGVYQGSYALIAIIVTAKMWENMVEGVKFAKAAWIVTQEPEKVAHTIMKQLERGVTGVESVGMYSKEYRRMLYCVVTRKEIVYLKELVYAIDETAFVVVGDVREVVGEGFVPEGEDSQLYRGKEK